MNLTTARIPPSHAKIGYRNRRFAFRLTTSFALMLSLVSPSYGQISQQGDVADSPPKANKSRFAGEILSPAQWRQMERSVDRALKFLARNQHRDGSFSSQGLIYGQPGITSLCVLAFLSRGHLPDRGPYGDTINRAVRFALATQHESGIFSLQDPELSRISGSYNHAITSLMLCEVYGMTDTHQNAAIRPAIEKAIGFTRRLQARPKEVAADRGGWRYLKLKEHYDSDMTATSWHLMFLRSARNAEFDVPKQWIDEAMQYVKRMFSDEHQTFRYASGSENLSSGVAGGGIVALALGGEHNSDIARRTGDWILRRPIDTYNRGPSGYDRFHYSAYYCSQAMFQLGGDYWTRFYPPLMKLLTENQNEDGSWDAESVQETKFGNHYTTALTVLALTPPYQLLPIYQR